MRFPFWSVLVLASSVSAAWAGTVTIGQVLPLSVPNIRDDALIAQASLKACVNQINQSGGINGNKLRVANRDDAFDGEKHEIAVKELIQQEGAKVLLGAASIQGVQRLIRNNVLTDAKVALVGPIIGSEALRTPMNPYVFHTRAGWVDEIRAIIEQMKALGKQRVAIVYQNDPDGRGGYVLAKSLLKRNGMEVVAEAGYDFSSNDVAAAARKVIDANPDAIFLSGIEEAGGKLLKQIRPAGINATLFGISVMNARNLNNIAGPDAQGTGISQTMPFPFSSTKRVVKDYREMVLKQNVGQPVSYLGIETYINCRVIAEGIRRAGPNPTGEGIMKGLESLQDFDLGGYKISFSPDSRVGSRFVEVTVMGRDGNLIR